MFSRLRKRIIAKLVETNYRRLLHHQNLLKFAILDGIGGQFVYGKFGKTHLVLRGTQNIIIYLSNV